MSAARKDWWCPHCPHRSVTWRADQVEFHTCSGLRGLWAPMLLRGERGRVVVAEREDWCGRDVPWTDGDGRAVASAEVVDGDGRQLRRVVYAPLARRALDVDLVAPVAPRDVRRRGAHRVRDWAAQALLRARR